LSNVGELSELGFMRRVGWMGMVNGSGFWVLCVAYTQKRAVVWTGMGGMHGMKGKRVAWMGV